MNTHGLLNYQVPHFVQLQETFRVRKCILDASDTGTGKTYVAMALAKELKLMPFVICPKSVVNNWVSVAKHFNVELLGIANYEMIKGCKFYNNNLEKLDCPYIEKIEKKVTIGKKTKIIEDYETFLPSDVLVIFDEAHRCKNYKSVTSRMLLSIRKSYCKVLLLSATIADRIICFKPFGIVFGFYQEIKEFNTWIRKQLVADKRLYTDKKLNDDQKTLQSIHRRIFPEYGSRMKIKDLGDIFPSNQVLSQSYMSENKEQIQEQYKIIQDVFNDLKNKEKKSKGIGRLIRARMKIEMFKIPIMLDIIEEALDSNYSVACFVNYHNTLEYLAHYFETTCVVHGKQTIETRQENINSFQSNQSKIIILNMQAGGVGISLHDLHGGHPRMSIISPTWSGQDMIQALGRIHRAGAQTPALQRIIFCAETYEEDICELIRLKLANITTINDSDLLGPRLTDELFAENQNNLTADGVIDHPDDTEKDHQIDDSQLIVRVPKDKNYKMITEKKYKKKFVKVVKNEQP